MYYSNFVYIFFKKKKKIKNNKYIIYYSNFLYVYLEKKVLRMINN